MSVKAVNVRNKLIKDLTLWIKKKRLLWKKQTNKKYINLGYDSFNFQFSFSLIHSIEKTVTLIPTPSWSVVLCSRLSSLHCNWGSQFWWTPPEDPEGWASGRCRVWVPGHPGCHKVSTCSTYSFGWVLTMELLHKLGWFVDVSDEMLKRKFALILYGNILCI